MAGKPPLQFTPFYESPRVKLARLWGKTKSFVGTSAVGGVVAVLAPIPGPHTFVLFGGMAVGAAVSVYIERRNNKKNKIKIKTK